MIAKDESDRALAHAPKDARRRPANAPSARRIEAGAFGPALGALVLAQRCLPRLDFDWDSFPSPQRQRQCGGRRYMARTAIVARQRMYAPWFAACGYCRSACLPARRCICPPKKSLGHSTGIKSPSEDARTAKGAAAARSVAPQRQLCTQHPFYNQPALPGKFFAVTTDGTAGESIPRGAMTRSEAALARRAAKRGRTVAEQGEKDRATIAPACQASQREEQEAPGDADEWNRCYTLVCEYRESQGSNWLGIVPKKLRLNSKAVGQWCKRQRQLQARGQLCTDRELRLKAIGLRFGDEAVRLLSVATRDGKVVAPSPDNDEPLAKKRKAHLGAASGAGVISKAQKRAELPSERLARKKAAKLAARRAGQQGGAGPGAETGQEAHISVFAMGLRELAMAADSDRGGDKEHPSHKTPTTREGGSETISKKDRRKDKSKRTSGGQTEE